SMWLAYQAHLANELWNESVPYWNKSEQREGLPRGRRSPHGAAIPEVAPFLPLSGHVRVPSDPRSTLYNTDGQIFSDGGVTGVLLKKNTSTTPTANTPPTNRRANIARRSGRAGCAIALEAVGRPAPPTAPPL